MKKLYKSSVGKGVSVIIPVYNRERFIGSCIESILSQNYDGNIEIIVSDDGSKDQSLKIARSYGDKIRIIEKSNNCIDQGASGARNRGLAVAKYSYISFLDSDDYYLPEHITRMVDVLDTNQDIGYVFCRSKQEVFSKNGEKRITNWTRNKLSWLDRKYHVLSRSYCINTNTIVFRSNVFAKVGVFNTSLSNGNDTEMWIRVAEKFKGRFVDDFGSVYRINHGGEQVVLGDPERKKKCSDKIYTEAFSRNYLDKNCDPLRLFLIVRALLYGRLSVRHGKKRTLYNHVVIMVKLFALFPITSIKFLKFRRR